MKCEYCRRSISQQKTCEGCGAPTCTFEPAFAYDPSMIQPSDLTFKPGRNTPVHHNVWRLLVEGAVQSACLIGEF